MSAADIHELTGWPLADIEPLFARALASATSTREALECAFAAAQRVTISSATRPAIERALEAKQASLRAVLYKTRALPWEQLDALHLEQLGRLVLHADGRRSLVSQLEALRDEDRRGAERRAPRRPSAARGATAAASAIITITLAEVHPRVWRRVSVPLALSLRELHDVIQFAMGWTHSHLHQFTIDGTRYTPPIPIDDEDPDARDDGAMSLGELARVGLSFEYEYDLGDCWIHEVTIDKIVRADPKARLLCLAGARACPPEDCGGGSGYELLVEALADRRHPEHAALSEWAPPGFDAAVFDIERANERLYAYALGRASSDPRSSE
jgi:hypothetical protein